MLILSRISKERETYTNNERRIADAILSQSARISQVSSSGLAELAEVSQSSVVKFVQKIGFDGWTDFRLGVSEEAGHERASASVAASNVDGDSVSLHGEITSSDDAATVAMKLLVEKMRALTHTTNAIDYKALLKIVTLINHARVVQITGLGGSMQVGEDFAHKLLKIGIVTLVDSDSHAQLVTANTLGAKDVQIAISYSGKRQEIIDAAHVAKRRRAKIVVITSPTANPLRDLADQSLFTYAEESNLRSSAISSRTAQHAITDLIFMMLVQAFPERNALIQDTHNVIRELRLK